ncbi:AAA+ family ATPase [Celeribacter sp. PS-C1]|uniref:AAA+ family ATPase n=1 Tax=Celeribacter sp. PS-C1 TaxID=2820813 RepID=UPI001CA5C985|nr:AAA+ family ATPase [Celeribacter sp. PS-C1]MBW6416690.1 AAA+ family ATPase [Celeribacter sp. PS-C1]
MKKSFLIPLVFLAAPALAEDTPSDAEEGWSLLREGSRLLLEHLFEEMGPALEELEGYVDDLNAYEAPVILPNGDILIKRKPEVAPEDETPETPEDMPEELPNEAIDL